ncbi:MAG TPA: serine hydrolase domain-containing protein [Pyrinomonadaceae bacterium]|nr:serine hydrolase domain-containing protein [Pyrinomonadaceae bacterium]
MTSDQISDPTIDALLAARIAAGDFPSAVYLVAEHGRVRFSGALGDAVSEPEQHAATVETIYDLASLTKPLVTGLLSALMVERGELELDRAVADYLPEFARAETAAITVRHLLTHTSGLPAWRPLRIATGDRRERVLEVIAASNLEYATGARVVYSDLGFITLGLLLERIAGATLDELAQTEIFRPLALERTFFKPERAFLTGVAACELGGNAYERSMCEAGGLEENAGASSAAGAWREKLIWGEVHDGNAYFLGGAAGHAGLFSTARETLQLADQFIATRTRLLKPDTCALFRTNMTTGLNEARSFAWQLAATKDSTAGGALPPDSFGHTGFTGTSCWVDASRERVFILLTNRTHTYTLPFVNINGVRRRFHTLAVAALDSA